MTRRLEDWHRETRALEATMSGQGLRNVPMSFGAFVNLSFRNIYGALADLRYLAFVQKDSGLEPCHMLNCPRLAAMTAALSETIAVLEKTKTAFKCKELGVLRKKLERVANGAQDSVLKEV